MYIHNFFARIHLSKELYAEPHKPPIQGEIITGNQVATKSLPLSEIFGKNPSFIIIYVNLICKRNECVPTTNRYPLNLLFKLPNTHFVELEAG